MEFPRVGVATIVRKNGKVLLGKRKSSNESEEWGFPGGHLEFKESFFECARRECFEEARIKICNLRIAGFTNDIFEEQGKHYVTCFVVADWGGGDAIVAEPEAMDDWTWISWNELPKNLFLPVRNLIVQGYNPFE